jgi:hypothetical protein
MQQIPLSISINRPFSITFLCFVFSVNIAVSQVYDTIFSLTSISNKLYLGIDNYIFIDSSRYSDSNFLYTIDNGHLLKDSFLLIAIPHRLPVAQITCFRMSDSDTLVHKTFRLPVHYAPQPIVMVGNEKINNNAAINKNLLLQNKGLDIYISNDIVGAEKWFSVNRFSIGYVFGGVYKTFDSDGAYFSNEMKHLISKMPPGSPFRMKVYLESNGLIQKELPIYNLTIR